MDKINDRDMQISSYGGNQVTELEFTTNKEVNKVDFAECSYHYYLICLPPNTRYIEDKLKSYTVLSLSNGGSVSIATNPEIYTLNKGDCAQVENAACCVQSGSESITLLVAGVTKKYMNELSIKITLNDEHKKVVKPWGHELWFNGEHPGYCLKEVMIQQGNRTSLQYHNFKEETNVLLHGKVKLVYKDNAAIKNDEVTDKDLGIVNLAAISTVHVTPKILHRLEAITDVLLYETSTPYLDDVIRVQDDRARQNGRVISEHSA